MDDNIKFRSSANVLTPIYGVWTGISHIQYQHSTRKLEHVKKVCVTEILQKSRGGHIFVESANFNS